MDSEKTTDEATVRGSEVPLLSKTKESWQPIITKDASSTTGQKCSSSPDPKSSIEVELKLLEPGTKKEEKQTSWRKFRGIILAITAALQFSLSALIIKVLNYHPFNLGVWRFLIMMIIPLPFIAHAVFLKKQKIFHNLYAAKNCSSTLFFLTVQAAVGSNSLVLLFYALQRLNVADTLVISTSAPVFVTILAFLLLGEKTGVFPIFMAFLTLCGVTVIAKPPIITGASTYDQNLMFGAILSFGSMTCLASCYIIIRYIRTVHHALVNFCFSVWGFVESVIMAQVLGVLCYPQSLLEVGLIFATAFLAFFAQTCLTLALKYEEAGPVSLVRTTEILFAFMWQFLLLGVVPDIFSILGAFLVIMAVILTAAKKIIANLPEDSKYRRLFWILLI